MFTVRRLSLPFLTVAICFLFSLAASAQATRTWVSGVGDDVNPCSRTAPCKTFAGAISKTATNGEINCLDPAGYGAVTVTKSITIDCEDTQGSILSAGTNGVIVNITSAADTKKAFTLRGISINGAGTGINGIRVLAANQVNLEEVVISGVTQHGVSLENTTGTTKVSIDSCSMRNNGGNGINTFIVGGNVLLDISNSRLNNNVTGLNLSNATKATISSSVINGNTTGLQAASATLGVRSCTISNNNTGITASAGGAIRILDNLITNNGTGLSLAGGTITSFLSNVFSGNTVDGTPSSSLPVQ